MGAEWSIQRDGRTDTETDMMKLIVAFHNFTNASYNDWSTPTNSSLQKKKKKKKERRKNEKKRIFWRSY